MKTINLIRAKTAMSRFEETVTVLFRKLSLWALAILIVSGVLVSGMFYYLQVRREQLTHTQQQLSQVISQSKTKEGLLVSVKQRSALISKILGVQQPVSKVFDTVAGFVGVGQMSGITLDDRNTVFLRIHAQSITDVISITDTLIKQTTANLAKAPQLVSLTLGKDGGVDVGLSFIAVF
jgi:hypothetical protein